MGYRSCELLLVDTLRHGLVLRNLPEDEQMSRRKEALRIAQRALRGRGDLERAFRRLRRVGVFLPEDEEITEALAAVESRLASQD